jgi:photosystem II stability/assembly factor-like uncharacterized protein
VRGGARPARGDHGHHGGHEDDEPDSAADGSYLASGHPGAGAALGNPVGLIRSTDGGDMWTTLSRAGKSDFHGLTAGSGLVAGYDGALRISTDGRSWQTHDIPSAPHVLAVSPDGGRLLATTSAGR